MDTSLLDIIEVRRTIGSSVSQYYYAQKSYQISKLRIFN